MTEKDEVGVFVTVEKTKNLGGDLRRMTENLERGTLSSRSTTVQIDLSFQTLMEILSHCKDLTTHAFSALISRVRGV